MSDGQSPRPRPRPEPRSFVEGLALVREQVQALADRVDALEAAVEELVQPRIDELRRGDAP